MTATQSRASPELRERLRSLPKGQVKLAAGVVVASALGTPYGGRKVHTLNLGVFAGGTAGGGPVKLKVFAGGTSGGAP